MLKEYEAELIRRELSRNTIRKYLKDVGDFLEYVGEAEITKELLISYKEELSEKLKVNSVNNKITIINNFLKFLDKDIKLKQEKSQRKTTLDNVLSETDFNRLIRMAETRGNDRARITMLSLYYTGVRVSELQFLTVEALKQGYMDIVNKGKHRRVPICLKLSKELKNYTKKQGVKTGAIIANSKGEPLSRSYIFRELKHIAGQARVKKDKVYPHSFRHLFAKQWLKHNNNNVLALADLLGHSSLDTTRIYTALSTAEQRETISF